MEGMLEIAPHKEASRNSSKGTMEVTRRIHGNAYKHRPYKVHLKRRLLPGSNKTAMETVVQLPKSRGNFFLVACTGEAFVCHKDLMRNTCLSVDVSNTWGLSELRLDADQSTTGKIAFFALRGLIDIDDECAFELMAAADFLGFDSLLKLCVKHVSRSKFPLEKLLEIHAVLSHVEGLSAAFLKKFNRMPIDFFSKRSDPSHLLAMNLKQLKLLLASDGLMVRSEDQALRLLAEWSKHNEILPEELSSCMNLIRYPLLSRKMEATLQAGSLGLPRPKTGYRDSGRLSRFRAGFDEHIHILWKEHRRSKRGPARYAITCLTWNKYHKLHSEENLVYVQRQNIPREDHRSAQFATSGDKIVKVAFNKSHDQIFVTHLDLEHRFARLRSVLQLSEERFVSRPDFAIPKGSPDFTICFHDRWSALASLDPETWEVSPQPDAAVNRALGNLPCHPWELQRFDDCSIAIANQRVFVCDVDFGTPALAQMPPARGNYVDFERIGNQLFVLEAVYTDEWILEPDVVHCVNIEKRACERSSPLPKIDRTKRYLTHFEQPEGTKKFLRVGSELFVVIQVDCDEPLHIFSYDVSAHECKPAVRLEAPEPDPCDAESVHSRVFLCAVSPRLLPCDRTQLQDL